MSRKGRRGCVDAMMRKGQRRPDLLAARRRRRRRRGRGRECASATPSSLAMTLNSGLSGLAPWASAETHRLLPHWCAAVWVG